MPRTACVWIPQFELQARIHADPSLCGKPVLIADAGSQRASVLDTSAEAQRHGIQRQMPMSVARALCPQAVIIPPDPAFLQQLSKRILAQLYRFSPLVGSDSHEAFFAHLDGLEQIHPDERHLAQALGQSIETLQLTAVVAIADSPISAWVVACAMDLTDGTAIEIVPRTQDRAYLARLPLDAIPMPEQIVRLCRVLGLQRVGDLQQLPTGALTQRFGRSGAEVEQRARARCRELFRIEIPETIEQSEIQLDQPTADFEPLLFLHKSVLDRLLKQVAASRRAIALLELTLVLSNSEHSCISHIFRPARPTLDGRVLLDLITLWLQSGPVAEPVDSIVMRALEVGIATARQLHLFDRQEDLATDALQVVLSRLIAAYGGDAVVYPRLCDRHLPERRLIWHPAHQIVAPAPPTSIAIHAPVLCLLDPPRPIEIRGDHMRDRHQTRWKRIVARDEPCIVEGEWWAHGFARQYTIVTTEDNEMLWIYHDVDGDYLQAYFD